MSATTPGPHAAAGTNAPQAAPASRPVDDGDGSFLPDFCAPSAVLAIVLLAALLGFVLALARTSTGGAFWLDLARTSGFLLWTGLLGTALLCRARPWLARQRLRVASGWALAMMVGTVALLSEFAWRLGQWWAQRFGAPSGIFPATHAEFVLPNVLIAVIVGGLALRYFYVSHQWRRSVELEARSRLRALQARIRPHFLFNSMNTIAALTRSQPARAEQAIEDLSDLFRASLNEARLQIDLAEEVEIARTYQRMEQLRLGARLDVRWEIDALPMHAQVPSLVLQPLLENAIGHGIEPLTSGGVVHVRGWVEGADLVVDVTNPMPAPAPVAPRRGHRMALDNVRERLELAYPGRASVDVQESDGRYCVRLRFPYVP